MGIDTLKCYFDLSEQPISALLVSGNCQYLNNLLLMTNFWVVIITARCYAERGIATASRPSVRL